MGKTKPIRVAIVSDIHFDLHCEPTWNAFKQWAKEVRPDKIVVLGDFLDFGMLSRYLQGPEDPLHAVDQIKVFVKEMNEVDKYTDDLIIVEGNHDERWEKIISGDKPWVFKGAKGLSLKEQCYLQGMTADVSWIKEDIMVRGVKCGPFILRHGHKQSTRFGGGKHVAANRLNKSLGVSEIFGHFHRAQMFCHTAHGKTAVAIANPHMTRDHDYMLDPDWQKGFTLLEVYGDDHEYATPYLILIQDGKFAYNGTLYDGNKRS